MTDHRKIYAVRNDRLGGRLGALLNAKRIADDYGLAFGFTWASHDAVSPELQTPEALFSEKFMSDYRETTLGFGDLQNNALAVETLPSGITVDWLSAQMDTRYLRCSEAMKAVVLPWETHDVVSERLAKTLHTVGFTNRVQEVMHAIRKGLGDTELVAYHLRRGDIIDPNARPSNVLWPTKYIPRVFYEEHIARLLAEDSTTRMVIFSDAPHEVSAFCALSERVIPATDLIPIEGLVPLQRDFLELYTMSLCKRIVAPGASAFSSVAAILGNSKIISIVADLTEEEKNASLQRLTTQMKSSPEVFAGDSDLGQNFPELIQFHRKRGTPDIARAILQKHHDRGFRQSYIHDLLSEENFRANDSSAAIALANTLRDRPILTDLGNAQTYAWAGLAALSAGNLPESIRLGHIAQWLQPNLPISRILISALIANNIPYNERYPIDESLIQTKMIIPPKFMEIAEKLPRGLIDDKSDPRIAMNFIPFELDLRDWHMLQSSRLPSQFWNVPNQKKLIGFFQSTYRHILHQPNIRSMLGQLYIQAEDREVGLQMIRTALADSPKDPHLIRRHARVQWEEGHTEQALEGFAEVMELTDQQTCSTAEYGLHLLMDGQKTKALTVFEELAGRMHHLIEVQILTADVLRRNKNTRPLALEVATRIDDLVPGGLRTSQIHRKVLEQMGYGQKAEAIAARFVSWGRAPGKFSSRIRVRGQS